KGFEGLSGYGHDIDLDLSVDVFTDSHENAAALEKLSNIGRLTLDDIRYPGELESIGGADPKEFYLKCSCDRGLLTAVYGMPNVTGLEISANYNSDVPDLRGIEAMANLKSLEIRTATGYPMESDGVPDFAPLANLPALEELSLTGNNGYNFDSLCSIKTLRSLSLSGFVDDEIAGECDLSVLSGCENIEYLEIGNIDDSIYSALSGMAHLKKLEIKGSYDFYDGMEVLSGAKNAEELILDGIDYLNLKGISALRNLKTLTLYHCTFDDDISDIAALPALKSLIIDCDRSELMDCEDIENSPVEELYLNHVRIMHAKSLANLPALKKLTLSDTDLTEEYISFLREQLPDCDITVNTVLPETEETDSEDGYDEDGEGNSGENTENSANDEKTQSYAEPLKTEYIGDVRIETYPGNDDYWDVCLYIKNNGGESVPSLPAFMEENGIAEGCDRIYISYPAHDGHDEAIEIFEAGEKGMDYETFELYLNALSPYEEDFIESEEYRALTPGCEASVLLHHE
ncbi:MAG: hypothetical protein NC078_12065, partial [Ruminococcus sp.]|nr:hypothetical protein [Ruminococcus sp.]